jgi:hypothetical protein
MTGLEIWLFKNKQYPVGIHLDMGRLPLYYPDSPEIGARLVSGAFVSATYFIKRCNIVVSGQGLGMELSYSNYYPLVSEAEPLLHWLSKTMPPHREFTGCHSPIFCQVMHASGWLLTDLSATYRGLLNDNLDSARRQKGIQSRKSPILCTKFSMLDTTTLLERLRLPSRSVRTWGQKRSGSSLSQPMTRLSMRGSTGTRRTCSAL